MNLQNKSVFNWKCLQFSSINFHVVYCFYVISENFWLKEWKISDGMIPQGQCLFLKLSCQLCRYSKKQRPINLVCWHCARCIYLCAISDMLDCVMWLFFTANYNIVLVNFPWQVESTSSLNTNLPRRVSSADTLLKMCHQNVCLFTLSFGWIACSNWNL